MGLARQELGDAAAALEAVRADYPETAVAAEALARRFRDAAAQLGQT